MHPNPRQYLQRVGNAGIWRPLSVVRDDPAVGEQKRGSFQARRRTKQDDYVRQQTTEGAGGRGAADIHTHTDRRETYFAVDSSSYLVFKSKSSA